MLRLWNVSKCIAVGSQAINTYVVCSSLEIWRLPQGATINWTDGYEWTEPIATNISGNPINLALQKVVDDVVLLTQEAPYTPWLFAIGLAG
jgi:hypothetical protein